MASAGGAWRRARRFRAPTAADSGIRECIYETAHLVAPLGACVRSVSAWSKRVGGGEFAGRDAYARRVGINSATLSTALLTLVVPAFQPARCFLADNDTRNASVRSSSRSISPSVRDNLLSGRVGLV